MICKFYFISFVVNHICIIFQITSKVLYLHTPCVISAKYTNHKGRNRRFTNPEELEQERIREEKAKYWRVIKNLIFLKLFVKFFFFAM